MLLARMALRRGKEISCSHGSVSAYQAGSGVNISAVGGNINVAEIS